MSRACEPIATPMADGHRRTEYKDPAGTERRPLPRVGPHAGIGGGGLPGCLQPGPDAVAYSHAPYQSHAHSYDHAYLPCHAYSRRYAHTCCHTDPRPTPIPRSRPTATPAQEAPTRSDWPLPNKDYASTRAVLDAEISRDNVDRLDIAWRFSIPASGPSGASATNPIVINGVVYFQDLASNVFALELKTGELLWDHGYKRPNHGPNGVAVAGGMVFAPSSPQTIAALDSSTGEEIWSVHLTRTETEGISIQPIAYDGAVYVGTVPGNPEGFYLGNATGIIYALDQETGEVSWSFQTVDSDDIWGNRDVNSGGGVWYPPTIDPGRGMTYWGAGNPAPWPGTKEFPNGSSRPGPNLYTNSLLALNHRSGELDWYNQVKPHDLFDHDSQLSPILVTTTIDDNQRDIVIGGGKTGTVIAFEADSGEVLWETGVGLHKNDHLDSISAGGEVEVFPGIAGGVETPMAYADGVVYVPVVNWGALFPTTAARALPFSTGTGELVAIDVKTGGIVWKQEFGSMVFGAATVVNDLVFTSTFDGMIYAFDRKTGTQIWTYQAPVGINGWPAVAGDTIIFPAGVPTGDAAPALLAFRIT